MRRFAIWMIAAAMLAPATADADDLPDGFRQHKCTMCHAYDHKVIGPAYKDVAAKYKGDAGALATLTAKVKNGGGGVWGAAKMTPHPEMSDDQIKELVQWILAH